MECWWESVEVKLTENKIYGWHTPIIIAIREPLLGFSWEKEILLNRKWRRWVLAWAECFLSFFYSSKYSTGSLEQVINKIKFCAWESVWVISLFSFISQVRGGVCVKSLEKQLNKPDCALCCGRRLMMFWDTGKHYKVMPNQSKFVLFHLSTQRSSFVNISTVQLLTRLFYTSCSQLRQKDSSDALEKMTL